MRTLVDCRMLTKVKRMKRFGGSRRLPYSPASDTCLPVPKRQSTVVAGRNGDCSGRPD